MARVALLCPDLLFGSKLDGMLKAAGHEVAWGEEPGDAEVAVVDLSAREEPVPEVPSLGFYSHVDVETRRRAEAAGFALVVPRSRMAREGAALVERLVA